MQSCAFRGETKECNECVLSAKRIERNVMTFCVQRCEVAQNVMVFVSRNAKLSGKVARIHETNETLLNIEMDMRF